MTPRAATKTTARHRSHPIDAVAHQLHSWKPFYHLTDPSNSHANSKPYLFPTKRPCRSDRSTAPPLPLPPDLDLSRLTLRDNPDLDLDATARSHRDRPLDGYKRWIARKRRRRGSRSVSLSGRSSCGDRSTTHLTLTCTCTAATCSDSSGELMSWGSDVSDVIRIIPKPKHTQLHRGGGGGDHSALSLAPNTDKEGAASASIVGAPGQDKDPLQGNESGYGSEPGYRGDGELGYGDEFDEDDEFDARHLLFWADHRTRDGYQREIEGENKIGELKSHHRNRRKKIIM